MDVKNTSFNPTEPTISKLRFYSIGTVAENKALDSNIIEVTPLEELTMLDGYLNADTTNQTASGVDSSGRNYTSKVKTGNTLQAEWLRLGDSNRQTSPDVRRGAPVVIFQFGDADKYYWTTMLMDSKLRKLETVVWGISATPNEGDEASHSTMYYVEFSSHTKQITLHTSQANGEQWGYDIQINPGEGFLTFTDTNGNYFKLNSLTESLTLQNATGNVFDITKAITTITSMDKVIINSPNGQFNIDNLLIDGASVTIKSPGLSFIT